MSKIKVNLKLLVKGLVPLYKKDGKPYSIDNYVMRTEKYDDSVIDFITENIKSNREFYIPLDLINILSLNVDGTNEYTYFETIDKIQYNIDNFKNMNNKQKTEYLLDQKEIRDCRRILEKKLRLIFGINIALDRMIIEIYDINNHFISRGMHFKNDNVGMLDILNPVDSVTTIKNRGRLNISTSALMNYCSANDYFNKALSLYTDSFNTTTVESGFLLIMPALECLLKSKGKGCKESIYENGSKFLYDNSNSQANEDMFKLAYDKRCELSHGDTKPSEITLEFFTKLRDATRQILLIYWFISQLTTNKNHEDILRFVIEGKVLSLELQAFIDAVKVTSDDEMHRLIQKNILLAKIKASIEK